MTHEDARRIARLTIADHRDFGAAWDAAEENIAAALVAAFNDGLEEAAAYIQPDRDWMQVSLEWLAADVRAKKIAA